jgi:hypothetical protein
MDGFDYTMIALAILGILSALYERRVDKYKKDNGIE